MRYTISEMASLLGVTTHTLRYYEKMGLIRPEVNEDTGYRYYTVTCLLYTSPSPRDRSLSRMPSSA